jgi:hypothetical protein
LEVRKPGDRRRGPWFFERRHGSDVSDRTRKVRMTFVGTFRTGKTAGWAGARRRRPATSPSSPPPPPDTSPPLLARKVAPTRMRGNAVRVNGSKVPYSLSAVTSPVRQETCGCVDNVRQFRAEQGS